VQRTYQQGELVVEETIETIKQSSSQAPSSAGFAYAHNCSFKRIFVGTNDLTKCSGRKKSNFIRGPAVPNSIHNLD
jgi:hypothetical protein